MRQEVPYYGFGRFIVISRSINHKSEEAMNVIFLAMYKSNLGVLRSLIDMDPLIFLDSYWSYFTTVSLLLPLLLQILSEQIWKLTLVGAGESTRNRHACTD